MNAETKVEWMRDDELLAGLRELNGYRHRIDARMLEFLIEVERRRLYASEGYSSLFVFCVESLNLSEDETAKRIQAARCAARFPLAVEMLRAGRLHLSGIGLLAPHLSAGNHRDLLERAAGKSKRAIAELVAQVAPRPDVPSAIRKLPIPTAATADPRGTSADPQPAPPPHPDAAEGSQEDAGATPVQAGLAAPCSSTNSVSDTDSATDTGPATGTDSAPATISVPGTSPHGRTPASRPRVEPLAAERYKVQFTADRPLRDKLLRAQDLMRHGNPSGDLAVIIDRALDLLIEQQERRKFGTEKRRSGGAKTGVDSAPATSPAATDAAAAAHTSGAPTPPWPPASEPAKTRGPASVAGAGTGGADDRLSTPSTAEVSAAPRAHISNSTRREVYERDEGRCTFVSADGRRCGATGFLEFAHVIPHALGGPPTAANLRLRCFAHNALEAEMELGREVAAAKRKAGSSAVGRSRVRNRDAASKRAEAAQQTLF